MAVFRHHIDGDHLEGGEVWRALYVYVTASPTYTLHGRHFQFHEMTSLNWSAAKHGDSASPLRSLCNTWQRGWRREWNAGQGCTNFRPIQSAAGRHLNQRNSPWQVICSQSASLHACMHVCTSKLFARPSFFSRLTHLRPFTLRSRWIFQS